MRDRNDSTFGRPWRAYPNLIISSRGCAVRGSSTGTVLVVVSASYFERHVLSRKTRPVLIPYAGCLTGRYGACL